MAQSLTPIYCSALLAMHAFNGYDSTSAFKGCGKLRPLQILEKDTDYKKVFSEIGKEWSLTQEDRDTLEAFICAIYGKVHIQDVNMVRFIKINEVCSNKGQEALKNVDMTSLPPCKRTLEQQLNRFNYQVTIWKRSHMPNPRIPDPPSTSVV